MARTTQIRIAREDAATLRTLAAGFELYITRGVGTGEAGNIALLLERLAAAYRRDPVGTLAALGPLVLQKGRQKAPRL